MKTKAKAKAARAAVERHPRRDLDRFGAFIAGVRDLITELGPAAAACDLSFECSGDAGERAVSIWIAEPGRRLRLRREDRAYGRRKRRRRPKQRRTSKAKAKA